MKWITKHLGLLAVPAAVVMLATLPSATVAQLAPPTGATYGGSMPSSKKVVSGIAWYGVLQDGLDEAKRTRKPILFITAAAQCGGISGMW